MNKTVEDYIEEAEKDFYDIHLEGASMVYTLLLDNPDMSLEQAVSTAKKRTN